MISLLARLFIKDYKNYADADVQMDLSGLEAEEEHRDSLDAWVGRYRESLVKYYDNEAEENPVVPIRPAWIPPTTRWSGSERMG